MGPGMMPHHSMSPGPMSHGPMASPAAICEPTLPGQDAFGAISEVVRILEVPLSDLAGRAPAEMFSVLVSIESEPVPPA